MTAKGHSLEKLHLLGVGGMGMAPLAIGLARAGWEISGEDDCLSWEVAKLLRESGVTLKTLSTFEESELPERVIYSSAIASDHPGRVKAESLRIPVARRGSFLAEFAQGKRLIAICGSHGKTTTAAMCAHLFADTDADYYVGALFQDEKFAPGRLNGSSILIAEIDESDGSIQEFAPDALCILNVDWDHRSQYDSEAAYREAFYELAKRTTEVIWTPESEIENFTTRLVDEKTAVRGLPDFSDFNQYNYIAASAISEFYEQKTGNLDLNNFPGVKRRQEQVYQSGTSAVYHDYAHHPREIDALIRFLKSTHPGKSIEVYYEPHRYTRTEHLAEELIDALEAADRTTLLPIYSAGEREGPPNSLYAIAQEDPAKFKISENASNLFEELRSERVIPENTVRAFVGAGNINFLAESYSQFLVGDVANVGEHLQRRLGGEWIRIGELLSGKTTMRVGGTAEVYAEPPNRESLREVLKIARLWGASVFFLGKGSNLIVPDMGIPSVVVRLNQAEWLEVRPVDAKALEVGAGVRLRDICKEAERRGMGGFEFMEGIPASLGGALRMNAGAMGGWMSDVIESIEVMLMDGKIVHLKKDDLHYGYRSINELANCVALSARLRATEEIAGEAVKARIQENMQKRKKSQPREASAGCIFKNPEGDHAGRLIDICGLKGHRVGDAQVSEAHANFIVNLGAATSEDIIGLVRYVRMTVAEKTGITLEPEAILVGQTWEEALS
ncbi:MAG: UDP-N-acetylmuramate dehydrogenase [Opitutales bacterium]